MSIFPDNVQTRLKQAKFIADQLKDDQNYHDAFRAGCHFSACIGAVKSAVYFMQKQLILDGRLPPQRFAKPWAVMCEDWEKTLPVDDCTVWVAVRDARDYDVHTEPLKVKPAKSGMFRSGYWTKGYWTKGFWHSATSMRFKDNKGNSYCIRDVCTSIIPTAEKMLVDLPSFK